MVRPTRSWRSARNYRGGLRLADPRLWSCRARLHQSGANGAIPGVRFDEKAARRAWAACDLSSPNVSNDAPMSRCFARSTWRDGKLPMSELRAIGEACGFASVAPYRQRQSVVRKRSQRSRSAAEIEQRLEAFSASMCRCSSLGGGDGRGRRRQPVRRREGEPGDGPFHREAPDRRCSMPQRRHERAHVARPADDVRLLWRGHRQDAAQLPAIKTAPRAT